MRINLKEKIKRSHIFPLHLHFLRKLFIPLSIACILSLLFFAYLYVIYNRTEETFFHISELKKNFSRLAFKEGLFFVQEKNPEAFVKKFNTIIASCSDCHNFERNPLDNKLAYLKRALSYYIERKNIYNQIFNILENLDKFNNDLMYSYFQGLDFSDDVDEVPNNLIFLFKIREKFEKLFVLVLKLKTTNPYNNISQPYNEFNRILNELSVLLEKFRSVSKNTKVRVNFVNAYIANLNKLASLVKRFEEVSRLLYKSLSDSTQENDKFLVVISGIENKLSKKVIFLRNIMFFIFLCLLFSFLLTLFLGYILFGCLLSDIKRLHEDTSKLSTDLSQNIEHDSCFSEILDLKNTINEFAQNLYRNITNLQNLLSKTKALSSELKKFALAVSQSPIGIVLVDSNKRVQFVNQAYSEMTGYLLEDLIGHELEIFQEITEDLKFPIKRELVLNRKDGSPFYARVLFSAIKDENNINFLAIIEDISKEKMLEERQELLSRLEILALTAGGLSHDFNNLLAAILSYLEMALLKPHLCPRYIEKAKNLCLKGKDFTSRLLSITKGGLPKRQKVSLPPIIKEAAEITFKGSSCELIVDFPPELYCVIGDRHQLLQVFQNLFLNAIEAMEGKGRIWVKTSVVEIKEDPELKPGLYLYISVADEGPGVPSEIREKIFHPFFTTKETGTGLGLATVYSVVKNHGGKIKVGGSSKGGALFEIYLPAKEREQKDKTPKTSNTTVRCAEFHGRILIIEDEEQLREGLKEMLEVLGFDVEEAASGKEGLEIYRRTHSEGKSFDFVIMDFYLKDSFDGYELLKSFRQINPNIRIIVSSGQYLDLSTLEALEIKYFLRKPYSFRELHDTIARLLRKS